MKFDDDHEQLLTKIEAARLLKVSARTLEIWEKKKLIQPVRFGRTVRYLRDDLLARSLASGSGTSPAQGSPVGEPVKPLTELANRLRKKLKS